MLWIISLIGKMAYWLTRSLRRGHGSALPGLIVEKLYPAFLSRLLAQLPDGVVLVSGTNGKTTTTKIITELLRADGYRVFTNPSGSNYVRGVISAALPQMRRGKLQADIAVLELDEAYATKFVDQVAPRYSLLLNVLRDQLDRFGEIDHTAELLRYVAERTKQAVIVNEDDPRLCQLVTDQKIRAKLAWFGYDGRAGRYYRDDEELHVATKEIKKKATNAAAVRLVDLANGTSTYMIGDQCYSVKLRLFGIHNALNCAAALSVVRQVEGDKFDAEQAVEHLGVIKPAYGRGEIITVGDTDVQLILVKNPSGFQISLSSAGNASADDITLIAINDAYADGRDVSWLWDVSFTGLDGSVAVTGSRAADMAIRLRYDDVSVAWVEPDIQTAVQRLVRRLSGGEGCIFATYTAMLSIRETLEQMGNGAK